MNLTHNTHVEVIKTYLNNCSIEKDRNNRILIVTKCYDYMVAHLQEMRDETSATSMNKFCVTIRKKLHEFAKTENLRFEKHYQLLFGEELPYEFDNDYNQIVTENIFTKL